MQEKINKILRKIEKLIPRKVYKALQPYYHFLLSLTGAIIYRFPSKKIKVIAITGTKGKSSTTEFVNAILEEAGYSTSILSTIRFKIGKDSKRNLYKMTMPGRFFTQKFLRESVDAGCDYAIIEMTSEGARFYRHKFTNPDYLLVTNITPEHIDSHGSYEKYLSCKLLIAKELGKTKNKNLNNQKSTAKAIITTNTQKDLEKFHDFKVDKNITIDTDSEEIKSLNLKLPGDFNKANAMLALTLADSLDIDKEIAKKAVENLSIISGRAEEIKINNPDQNFKVVIDYAHTVDSLEKIYSAYSDTKIAVLGSCGGGRDKGKRSQLGETADKNCEIVIVTDEDPYDDDVTEIINDVASGIKNKELNKNLFIEIDRRKAIRIAIEKARDLAKTKKDVAVIVSGKGTDPYIMRANNKKEKWSDAEVAREELLKIFA